MLVCLLCRNAYAGILDDECPFLERHARKKPLPCARPRLVHFEVRVYRFHQA